jgi:IS6 family transposase
MMAERGFSIDHTTLYRWVQHYAPALKKRFQWHKTRYSSGWHLDETYLKVKGEWNYLYRAIHKINLYLNSFTGSRRKLDQNACISRI